MRKWITRATLLFLFFSCNTIDKYDKTDPLGAKRITSNLYLETYCVYRGGVYAGNTYACYLTDSTHFRIFLGLEDDGELFEVIPMDDSIIFVRKYETTFNKTLSSSEYNLNQLKREGKFE